MSEWWGYQPRDFLLFAPRTYWRLFELENAALWPLPAVTLIIGVTILVLTLRPRPWAGRAIALAMAAAWAWVGWSFIDGRYAAINWAATYLAPAFYAEAVFLAWLGTLRGQLRFGGSPGLPRRVGLGLVAYAVALHPLTALAAGRPLAGAEIVGIAPDPTAIATLGLMALLPRDSFAAPLMLIPAGWCLASWATLATMGAWQAWIALGAVLLAVGARAWTTLRPRRARAPRDE